MIYYVQEPYLIAVNGVKYIGSRRKPSEFEPLLAEVLFEK